ncbi:MAG: sulfotransferase domain-containing protein [Phycisphaerales bacterium JB060]
MPAAADMHETPASPIPTGVRPVVVASHPRSGTHMMLDFLRRQFDACCPPFRFGVNPHRYLYFVLDRFCPDHKFHVGVEPCLRVMRSTEMPCLKTHSLPDFLSAIPEGRRLSVAALRQGVVLYCVRDVRAVMASLHAFDRVTGDTETNSLSAFIREEIDGRCRVAIWADHVRAWIKGYPDHRVIRYEEMAANPGQMLEKLGSWFGQTPKRRQPLLPPKLKHRQRLWLARLTGVPESTNVIGRKVGVKPLDWRTAYTPADIAFLEEHAGEAMSELGYVPGGNWGETIR